MNAVEIEEAVSELAEQPFDAEEFPFALLVVAPFNGCRILLAPGRNLWAPAKVAYLNTAWSKKIPPAGCRRG